MQLNYLLKNKLSQHSANQLPFIGAPVLRLSLALLLWVLYPHQYQAFYIIFGILYFLCVSRTSVYSTFLAGWCSNSKYALLGALRGVAQTISYEVRITLILICALILLNTIDLTIISMRQSTPIALTNSNNGDSYDLLPIWQKLIVPHLILRRVNQN